MGKSNKIIIESQSSIGQISAETDDSFLFNCFVDHPAYSVMVDGSCSKMFLLGGTGIGKTAVIRMILKNKEHTKLIELEELSMSYLSNSDAIRFARSLDYPLEIFYQTLWKHVILLEYIRSMFKVTNEQSSMKSFARLRNFFSGDDTKKTALKYLEDWEGRFWVNMDENMVELTKRLESEISAEFASEISKFSTQAGYSRTLSDEKRTQLQTRLRKAIDQNLLGDLAHVTKALSEYSQKEITAPHYILIDKIDENWIEPAIRYDLIRGLVEALKGLLKIPSLKVVVALRSDVFEKVIFETRQRGFQSEKYEDYLYRIFWTSEDLKELINKRINYLFRSKYTKENVFFEDVFPEKINKVNSFRYIVERTLHRPRDIIQFVNICLRNAGLDNGQISETIVRKAESEYSENRKQALFDEWRSVYPALEPAVRVLEGRQDHITVRELYSTSLTDNLFHYFDKDEYFSDPIWIIIEKAINENSDNLLMQLICELVDRLHIVGAIGVKSSASETWNWFYKDQKKIGSSKINLETKIKVHPMLHNALNIRR